MNDKGFFGSLFDLSFTEFVTTRIIKLLFIVGIVAAGIGALAILGGAIAAGGFLRIVLGLVLTPVAFVLYVLLVRVWLELIIVMFRIAENTGRLVEQGNQPAPDSQ